MEIIVEVSEMQEDAHPVPPTEATWRHHQMDHHPGQVASYQFSISCENTWCMLVGPKEGGWNAFQPTDDRVEGSSICLLVKMVIFACSIRDSFSSTRNRFSNTSGRRREET
jgi:hypothetical protein